MGPIARQNGGQELWDAQAEVRVRGGEDGGEGVEARVRGVGFGVRDGGQVWVQEGGEEGARLGQVGAEV